MINRDYVVQEIVKQAGLGSWFAKEIVAKAPRNYIAKNTIRKTLQAAPKGATSYKGFFVSKNKMIQRVVPKGTPLGAPNDSMFSPKGPLRRTVGALKDYAEPWKRQGTIGSKLKDTAQQAWNRIKYKPGDVFKGKNGQLVQNMHERTLLGKGTAAAFSGGGTAAGTYMSSRNESQPKRLGSSLAQGAIWGSAGMPIAGPIALGKAAVDVTKAIKQRKQQQQMMANGGYYA
jgi:hypothetical protein